MKLDNIFHAAVRKESFFIPKEMVITGSVDTEMPGQVAGVINGNVFVKNKVIILKEGVINGDISAEELLVYGRINGDVLCSGKMLIQNGAVIKGNIITSEIHIEKDTIIEGVINKSFLEPVQFIERAESKSRKNEISDNPADRIVSSQKENVKRQAWF